MPETVEAFVRRVEKQDRIKEVFENFQLMVENPESAKILGAIIGGLGPSEREKLYPVIKALVDKVGKRAASKRVAYWEKKRSKK